MSLWTQAKAIADQTPASRNRAADFFRAAAIICVTSRLTPNVSYKIQVRAFIRGKKIRSRLESLTHSPKSTALRAISA